MRVLHLAPLWLPITRDSYGGIETFLATLLEALEGLGCRNTVLATGDSRTSAELLPVVSENLVAQMETGNALEYHHYEQHQLMLALERGPAFDIVHSHLGPRGLFLSGVLGLRVVHTWHTQVYRDMEWFVRQRPDLWLCAVSEHQARALRAAGATHCEVIHNGVDVSTFPFAAKSDRSSLLFLGRMEHSKGADLAIGVTQALGRPLILAGPIVDREFFARSIEPFLDDRIRYVGIVDHAAKTELICQAACVLMPSRIQEAYGVVAIEAMVCGTPVVALANGALPEIIEPHLTGFVADEALALPELVTAAEKLDPHTIRQRAVDRFSVAVSAKRYVRLYAEVIAGAPSQSLNR
jgi:glycosyltransferase involved in cell wall biosynthesis